MATYCLLALRLVESSNWYATHCFKVHGAVCSTFQSATGPFRELKLLLELQISEKLSCTLSVKQTPSCVLKRMQNIMKVTLILMQNGGLFLLIQNVQKIRKTKFRKTSQKTTVWWRRQGKKYGKPDDNKSRKQRYGSARRRKNEENLASTSLEDNISAALTGRKCSQKPTVDPEDKSESKQTSTLKKLMPNSLAESSCRWPCQCVSFPVFLSFSCSPAAAGDSCSHEESLSRTVLRKHRLLAA